MWAKILPSKAKQLGERVESMGMSACRIMESMKTSPGPELMRTCRGAECCGHKREPCR